MTHKIQEYLQFRQSRARKWKIGKTPASYSPVFPIRDCLILISILTNRLFNQRPAAVPQRIGGDQGAVHIIGCNGKDVVMGDRTFAGEYFGQLHHLLVRNVADTQFLSTSKLVVQVMVHRFEGRVEFPINLKPVRVAGGQL